ncbi:DNA ligase [Uliginosibacterium paludis]|uniref:DNA ligase n=1 Tax=Uliginosibacterium paludis TaxID=1615952 RepID=A0ABV2CRW6_9RHOO
MLPSHCPRLLSPLRHLLACLALLMPPAALAQPDILLAEIYRQGIDPRDYLVSEKYDGVRAIWNGHDLVFRSGQAVPAPDWFIRALPPVPLDGELWAGRQRFEWLSGVVRKLDPVDAEWRELRYMIFELPGAPGDFRERAARIRNIVAASGNPALVAVEQRPGTDHASLKAQMDRIVAAGGEGLMLHLADAPYVTGRSDVLLKLKPWLDAEARVIEVLPGRGRHAQRMGSLLMEMPDGKRFRLGTGFTDAQREHPPAPGSLLTYRYQALTAAGLPRFPAFLRLRELP